MEPQESIKQKMITLAQNPDHVEALFAMLKRCMSQGKLVGDSEYATVVNAVTFDTQGEVMIKMIELIDYIKSGGLLQEASEGK